MSESLNVIGANVSGETETEEFELGTIAAGEDGNRRMYIRANGAVVAGDFVTIDESFDAKKITSTSATQLGLRVGIVEHAMTDNYYGFAVIEGLANGKLGGLCAAHAKLYTSATAGMLDDSSTSQTVIGQIINLTAVATAAALSPCRLGSTSYGDY